MEYTGSSHFTLNRKLGIIQQTTPEKKINEMNNLYNNLDSSIAQLEFQFKNLKELSNQNVNIPSNNHNYYANSIKKVNAISLSPLKTPYRSHIRKSPVHYYQMKQNFPKYAQTYTVEEEISLNTYAKKASELERTLNHKENILNQYIAFIQKTLGIYNELTEENIKLKQQLEFINQNQLDPYQGEDNQMEEYNNNMYIYQNDNEFRNTGKTEDEYLQMEMMYKEGEIDIYQKDSLNIMNNNLSSILSKENEIKNDIQLNELKEKNIDLEREVNNTNNLNNNNSLNINNTNNQVRLCSNVSEPIY